MLLQTMGSILSSSTSNSGPPSPSLLNTNELLEMLMLPDSRGLTRNTDHLGALLRTNTWPSFFTGLGLNKKSLHSCPLLLLHSWWNLGELSLFVYTTFKVIKKNFFFLLQRKFYVVLNCNIRFSYPKETWCLERLLIFMKNTFWCVGLIWGGFYIFLLFLLFKKRKKVC